MGNGQDKTASAFKPAHAAPQGNPLDFGPDPMVYLVDDDESIRFLMRTLLEGDGIDVATYATAEEFLASYRHELSGCLVLDLHLPGISGLELQRILVQRGMQMPIIFFTAQGSVPKAVMALKNGAVDFVEKPFDNKDLLRRIREYLRLDAEGRERRGACFSAARRLASLTPREREVMGHIMAGRLNKHIAGQLNICVKTVEFHRARIMEKMGAHSLAELVQLTVSTRVGHFTRGEYV